MPPDSTANELPATFDVPGSGSVRAAWTLAPSRRWMLVYAPGAGSSLEDPFGAHAAPRLAARGVSMLRFAFPYMEARRRAPDRPPVLEATWRAAMASARDAMIAGERLAIGGRSMGGRIASMVLAATPDVADALVLFAYPLHPPKRPEQARTAHLVKIAAPTLFVSGTKDGFGTAAELTAAARLVRGATLRLLDGADHGYGIAKSSGRAREDVWDEALDALVEWLGARA